MHFNIVSIRINNCIATSYYCIIIIVVLLLFAVYLSYIMCDLILIIMYNIIMLI